MIVVPDSDDRLRPPTDPSISWTRSPTMQGRAAASVHWTNNDSRTSFGLIEVTGRFGKRDPNDIPTRLDGRELPAEGLCGHWLRRYDRPDDGERGVFFDGLWPGERYCFSPNASDAGGGVKAPYPSVGAESVCQIAPWRTQWGEPATP